MGKRIETNELVLRGEGSISGRTNAARLLVNANGEPALELNLGNDVVELCLTASGLATRTNGGEPRLLAYADEIPS